METSMNLKMTTLKEQHVAKLEKIREEHSSEIADVEYSIEE